MTEVNKQFFTIQIRRGLESELAASNVILASGEPVYAIDSKILKIGEGTKTWSQLTSYSFQTGSFANSVHTHDISGIIDLQSALDSKQPSGNIPISDISGLQDQLDAKQVAGDYSVNGHTHTSSEITDFTDSVNALIPVSNIVAGDNISITQDGTVFTINGSGGGGSNFTPNYEVYTSSISLMGRIDYAENKQVQNIDLLGSGIIISKGSGWPSSNQNVSNEIICRFNVTHPSGASISWNILSEWYNEPSDPLPSGSHLVALRTMKIPDQSNFIIGTYLGYKTIPSSDNSLALLLHFDGDNDSTTFMDSSPNNYDVTGYGNAKISTAQSQLGGSSLLLDDSGDYVRVEDFSSLDFTTGDWTLEAWIYPTNVTGERAVLATWDDNLANFVLGVADGEAFLLWNVGAGVYASGGTVSVNQWHHLAATRSGNTGSLFLDGTLVDTVDLQGDADQGPGSALQIGKIGIGYSAWEFAGHIDEVRIIKGVALSFI